MSDQDEMFPGGHVVSLDQGGVVASLSAWAREFGVHYETLRRGLMERGVQPVGKHRGHDQYLCRDVVAALSGSAEAIDPEKLSPFNRRAWYQGELDKLKLQQSRREVIPRIEVEQEVAAILKIVVERDEGLPDVLERDCGATPAQLVKIEAAIDKSREEMARRMLELAGPEQPAEQEPSTEAAPKQRAKSATPTAGPSTLDAACDFLRQALQPGQRLQAELQEEASAHSISESSLRRAKAKLGIIAKRAGKAWAWVLPEDSQGTQAG